MKRALTLVLCVQFVVGCANALPVRRALTTPSPSPSSPVETLGVTAAATSAPGAVKPRAPAGARVTPRPQITAVPSTGFANSPTLGGCPMFPDDNPWNRDVSADPVHPRSDAYIASINAGRQYLHADFGANPDYGIPFIVVPEFQTKVPITFTEYGDESDPGPYPIPQNAPIEAGSDKHVLALQQGSCKLYELYHARPSGNGWNAGSGAVFDVRSNALRPERWTSADAAGLPILPGLARFDEIAAGRILHALRFTVQRTQRGYIHPATHYASSSTDDSLPPMGLRLRLKSSFDLARYTGQARVILAALQRHGMIVADNGSSWFITGATDARWNDDDLNQLKGVPGSAFEAVDSGSIMKG